MDADFNQKVNFTEKLENINILEIIDDRLNLKIPILTK